MDGEIIPGTSVGPWALDTPREQIVELLTSMSVHFTEASPGGFDFINTASLSFSFGKSKALNQICVISAVDSYSFRGVSLGSKVEDLGKLGLTVSFDIADRLLVVKELPGIFFNFEGDDLDYELLEEMYFEGDEEQVRDAIRPNDVLQSGIDRICITKDPEINPMLDLNP